MPPAVHLRPDRLRAHAAQASELGATVQAALAARPHQPFVEHLADLDRLETTLRRTARELAELGAVLTAAADTAEAADAEVARALRHAGRAP